MATKKTAKSTTKPVKPEWVIVEVLKLNRSAKAELHEINKDNAPEDRHYLATCEHCNSGLIAMAYKVKKTGGRKVITLGSACVKKYTGMTASEIAGGWAAYEAASIEEALMEEAALARTKFFEANKKIIAHLEHRANAEAVATEAAWKEHDRLMDEGKEDAAMKVAGRYSDFWRDTLARVLKHGSLTERQMTMIKEDMTRGKGDRPAVGTRQEFTGKVIDQKVTPGYMQGQLNVKLTVRNKDYDWIVSFEVNSGLGKQLGVVKEWFGGDWRIKNNFVGQKLAVIGTVKSLDPGAGRLWINRAGLVTKPAKAAARR